MLPSSTSFRSLSQIVIYAALSFTASAVQSAELGDFYNLGLRPQETAIRVGAVVTTGPRYQGASEQKASAVPGIFIQASNGLFADPLNGIGYVFAPAGDLQYGLRVNVETGRSVDDALPGFEKVKARLNPGAFANYVVNDKLTLRSALRLGMGDVADGSLLHLGASYKVLQAGFFSMTLNASLKYADSNYMQTYFGVSPLQSSASGFKTHQPSAGFVASKVGVTAATPLSREVFVFANVSAQRLMGDAANSPLARQKTQPSAFLGAVYSF
jgi:outer membrane scaffolding protein for murein synthesis (MipA/OmpV family)